MTISFGRGKRGVQKASLPSPSFFSRGAAGKIHKAGRAVANRMG
ncbi:hypothetical protein HMPREF7215_1235 [Pyramidobacter piscolens W5455]|uniref:Uncharacterized protein n=1 Tax=Pyramidobacter piscolens W5455 TaxID=352165 RepID=A0ABM9ZTT9_9BACT|nr:hypothetical protein HMPREF7215_1235 [Pyramidobacter piscolens W5455]